MIAKIKDNYKIILYTIAGLFILYGFIWITNRKPQMPADLKATIDSLTNINKQLIEHQKQIDSTIAANEAEVHKVDFEINNIKEKTTIIKEYYHEISNKVSHYNAAQVDSFFKARYNY